MVSMKGQKRTTIAPASPDSNLRTAAELMSDNQNLTLNTVTRNNSMKGINL